jgi:hypothetical protein
LTLIELKLEINLKLEIESERNLFIEIEIYMESKFIRVEIGIESVKSKWKLKLIWVEIGKLTGLTLELLF